MVSQNVQYSSTNFIFRFYHDNTSELHALARHRIVFADQNQQICRMPVDFQDAAREIEESE
ncbi:hypothetical protein CCP4SC76_1550018 [Gammaproteobacteria bacterium]